jgi:regulator of CtrA degradation
LAFVINPLLNISLRQTGITGILLLLRYCVGHGFRLYRRKECRQGGALRAGQLMSEMNSTKSAPIRLSEHRVYSDSFKPLYSDGMKLVEEAAAYLDGEGRAEAKRMSRLAATLYAAESMRLTTRLMQVASWLLLQRAANNGEMSRAQVADEKSKVRLDTPSASLSVPSWEELPEKFKAIVGRSLKLQTLVAKLDKDLYGAPVAPAEADNRNAVVDQLALLKTAFGSR